MAEPLIILLYIILTILILILIFYLYWKLWFCRKPKREFPTGEKKIISPANGKIAIVTPFTDNIKVKKWNLAQVNILGSDVAKTGWFVLIVMNPLNVHVQRAPMIGTIEKTLYTKGKFLNAVNNAESLSTMQNERNEMLLKTKYGKIKIVQIAGMLARRIECYVKAGQHVEKGEEIGFINLGSQVALLMPKNVKIAVKPGDTVYDGSSVIGEFQ